MPSRIKQIGIYSGILTVYFNSKYVLFYIYPQATRMPPRDFTFWAKIPAGAIKIAQTMQNSWNFSWHFGRLFTGVSTMWSYNLQKVLSSADVPPEKLLDLPGLPRCKNLWSSLFCTFCFPKFYCVDFFVSFTLRHSWVSQVLSPRMSRSDLPRHVESGWIGKGSHKGRGGSDVWCN